jgi:hypothetical protein
MIEALRKFIISQGPSKNINNLEWASFWAENKKVIDPIALRVTGIKKEKQYSPLFLFLIYQAFQLHFQDKGAQTNRITTLFHSTKRITH